jgi:CubicO group peptidase (beta-lactamase class C family)
MARSSAVRKPAPANRNRPASTPPLPTAKPESVGLSSQRFRILTDAINRCIDQGTLPGAVMMVARSGKVAFFEALGRQDPATTAPMARDTIFRIMSMTKPIVSIGLMMLIEDGHLLLGDPVSKFIPEFRDQRVGVERDGKLHLVPLTREVTVQDLMRHTSGIVYGVGFGNSLVHRAYAQAELHSRALTLAELAARIATLPLACQPGTQFNYSFSTDIVARIIEIVSGQKLSTFLVERILAPLQMTETAFYATAEQKHRLAQPFPVDPWTKAPVKLYDMLERPAMESGGGGLVSTAADYSRFCQMLLNGGSLNGHRIIGKKTLQFMASNHLGPDVKIVTPVIAPGASFGLGFGVRMQTGMAPAPGTVGQFQWAGVAGTAFWIDPAENMFAIFLSQAPGQMQTMAPTFRNLVHAAIED